MSHNFPCSPQGGNPHLLYRQKYTRWDIFTVKLLSLVPQLLLVCPSLPVCFSLSSVTEQWRNIPSHSDY